MALISGIYHSRAPFISDLNAAKGSAKKLRKKARKKKQRHLVEFAQKLRKEMTEWEILLNKRLLKEFPSIRFRTQRILWGYIVDFWCPTYKIVIEVDGMWHSEEPQLSRDEKRDRNLEKKGVAVLRFQNHLVKSETAWVISQIRRTIRQRSVNDNGLAAESRTT